RTIPRSPARPRRSSLPLARVTAAHAAAETVAIAARAVTAATAADAAVTAAVGAATITGATVVDDDQRTPADRARLGRPGGHRGDALGALGRARLLDPGRLA